jgi:hypothetical protein
MAMALTAPDESLRDIFGRFWPCMRGDRCRLLAAGSPRSWSPATATFTASYAGRSPSSS